MYLTIFSVLHLVPVHLWGKQVTHHSCCTTLVQSTSFSDALEPLEFVSKSTVSKTEEKKKSVVSFFSSLKAICPSLGVITKTCHMLLLKTTCFISFCLAMDLSNILGLSFQLRSGLDSNQLFKGKHNLG